MLNKLANSKIKKAMAGIDKSEQLQSVINPELLFRRNSINLYIGRRGSGKTFNVMRELVKLSALPGCGGYNSFVYVTDKKNDSTVNELLSLIKLRVKVVSYANACEFITDLVDAKNGYNETLEKGLQSKITQKCREDFFRTLDLTDWTDVTPSTVVLYDDAINIFKSVKNKPLLDLLHQNRQSKITYFLCLQDAFSLPPQIKRNLDTCLLFGGYSDRQMLLMLLRQLNSSTIDNQQLIQDYFELTNREALLFDYLPDGTLVKIVRE
jgi:hypothetical protein